MLGRTVEIRYMRQANRFRSLNKGTHRRGVLLRRPLADRERTSSSVPGVIAGWRILHCLVCCKRLVPGPTLDAALGPAIETR
jgi:hypothetical protein